MRIFVFWVEKGFLSVVVVVTSPSKEEAEAKVRLQHSSHPDFKDVELQEEVELKLNDTNIVYSHDAD